jgi:UDP-glucose 4-epimerase
VLAFSSITHGDSTKLPKVEGKVKNPSSTFVLSKLMAEYYAHVFQNADGLDLIGLRNFNFFAPK